LHEGEELFRDSKKNGEKWEILVSKPNKFWKKWEMHQICIYKFRLAYLNSGMRSFNVEGFEIFVV